MASFCSLCNVSVAPEQLHAHRTSAIHFENYRRRKQLSELFPPNQTNSASTPSFPSSSSSDQHMEQAGYSDPATEPWMSLPYVEATQWGFKCLWCDRMMHSADQMDMHLHGKEHSRRCINSGISPYGDPDHEAEAIAYVQLYGHDPYARLAHWPDCIEASGQFWVCKLCKDGKKKYQTQRDVNDHLSEESHIRHMAGDYLSSGTNSPNQEWPACVVQDGHFWKCTRCNLKFNSPQGVEAHLVHPRHVKRAAPASNQTHEWSDTLLGCYLCMDFYDKLVEDDHMSSLGHICAMYCITVDGFA